MTDLTASFEIDILINEPVDTCNDPSTWVLTNDPEADFCSLELTFTGYRYQGELMIDNVTINVKTGVLDVETVLKKSGITEEMVFAKFEEDEPETMADFRVRKSLNQYYWGAR
jgi:hypothetical protein